MDAITPTQAQTTVRRPVTAPNVGPEVATPDVHLITHIDATEPVIEPFATLSIQQLEEMKKSGGANFTADVSIDRKTEAPALKIAKGVLTTAAMLAPLGAGIAVACTAGSFIVGGLAIYLGFKGTKALALKGFLQKGLGRIMSGIKESKMEEPRWDGRRVYQVEADKTGAIDSKIVSQGDLPKMRDPNDISKFLINNMKAYPSGTTVVHMMGHGLGYRYSAGLPFSAYEKVLEDTTKAAGKPADIVLLESCLQGNLEALAATSSYSRYSVLSEETVSAGVIGEILKNTAAHNAGKALTPRELGTKLIEESRAMEPAPGTPSMNPSAETLVLVDNAKVPALVAAVDRLGLVLADEVKDGRKEFIEGAVKGAEQYPKHPLFKSMRKTLAMGDLKDFCERLDAIYQGNQVDMPDRKIFGPIHAKVQQRWGQAVFSPRAADIRKVAGEVLSALNQAVVASHISDRYKKAGGVSIQLPGKFEKMENAPHYKKAGLGTFDQSAAPDGWRKFVDGFSA
ncbi:MAG: hypothetical protein FJX76_17600 [Armatimonadetes bacterium]|nr:hypothetical protein [Armatimonadota bacterium]